MRTYWAPVIKAALVIAFTSGRNGQSHPVAEPVPSVVLAAVGVLSGRISGEGVILNEIRT